MPVELKSEAELEQMRRAGRINAEVRALLMEAVKPGVTGLELDELANREIENRGAVATFKGYAPGGRPPYPGAICYSVNEELVHGIPNDRALEEGDIVSVDLGATFEGWVSDAAFTAPVGDVSQEALDLIQTTREALWCGIENAQVGNHLGDVSFAIGDHAGAYGIIDEYGGHGVGRDMHEEPHILNKGRAGAGMKLRPGMVIALEPMFALGHPATQEMDDRWTVVMRDGGLSAHWEETIAITTDGPEVLTRI
jgi:methionyl aminopeptidase